MADLTTTDLGRIECVRWVIRCLCQPKAPVPMPGRLMVRLGLFRRLVNSRSNTIEWGNTKNMSKLARGPKLGKHPLGKHPLGKEQVGAASFGHLCSGKEQPRGWK